MSSGHPSAEADLPEFLCLDNDEVQPTQVITASRSTDSIGHVPGEAGLWFFILGDMTLFGAILLVLLWERRSDRDGFHEAASQLIQPIGAVNTLVLLLSSYLVVAAVIAHRRDQHAIGRRLVIGAMGCALTFACLKGVEYFIEIAGGHIPSAGLFFTFYFVLTGLHLLHVVVGAALLSAWTAMLKRRRPWNSIRRTVESVATYWHMVDLLWIAIFTLMYLVCAE